MFVVKRRRSSRRLRLTISSSPGSKIGISPRLSRSIFEASVSTQTTSLPDSAKQVPVTSPTYPVPTTAIFINFSFH